MSKGPIRDTTYQMESQDRVLRVTKWSVKKWFTIIGEIGDLVDETMADSDVKDTTQLMAKLVVVLCDSQEKAVRVVKESVADKLTDEEILEWDLEDFLGVFDKALEINLTPSIEKKLSKAMGRIFKTNPEKAPETKKAKV